MTELIEILTEILRDIADLFRGINHSLITRFHWRPAIGLRFDFTTRSYFVMDLSLIFWTARFELWRWEA